jgi:outer membrane protein assembly factor BamB/tetratricopeptide (TPR) repeat protein
VAIAVLFFGCTGRAATGVPHHSASKFYPDSSDTAEALLRNAAGHARDGQWAEAIEIYQRIIDQYGDKVGKIPREEDPKGEEDFALFVDLRARCHRLLAKLPPEGRTIYRNRVDGVAQRWFREGQTQRDTSLLRRVVEVAFCSSWGDDALDLLGDLAFQDGRFSEALAIYRRLVPDHADDSLALVYPDPSVDLARIAAKKILCRAAAGESLAVFSEIDAYRRRFPDASGTLAGRKGPYALILEQALQQDHLGSGAQPDNRWPTFAGSLARSRVVAEAIDVGSLQWKVPLERIVLARPGYGYGAPRMSASGGTSQERLLGYHPIVLGDQVIVCDGTRVLAYNLSDRPGGIDTRAALTIEPAWKYDPEAAVPPAYRGGAGIPRYTLTAVGHRIFARVGAPTPPAYTGFNRTAGGNTSAILALDSSAQGKLLWMQKASDLVLPNRPADRANRWVSFEGTPVADSHQVYVAVTDRREQTATYVVCFDAETGVRRWVRYLGAASTEVDNLMAMGGVGFGTPPAGDYGHRLLSLAGPHLFYQTNLGAVVALEAETGVVRWVASYPRQDNGRMGGSDRDLNPAVCHDGLVIIGPSDAAAIYAFDADSGRLVWKTDPIAEEVKLAHLLGVAKGRLVATGDRVLLFDVKTGKLVATWPDSSKSEGYGRGLLAGERIYWPTRDRIEVLDQATGVRAEPPIKLMELYQTTGGNLVAGDGYLIVAQPDALVVFCQNSRLIQRYRDEIAHDPQRASTHYRLARAAEAVGRDELALESYEAAIRWARPEETIDGEAISEAARGHEFRLLLRLATTARGQQKLDQAASALETAARIARSDGDRLSARLLSSDIELQANRPDRAIEILQQELADEKLRVLTVSAEDGHRAIRADLLITDRLRGIIGQRGRKLYAIYDRRAAELFDRGRRDGDPRALEELSRSYPVAEVVPEALLISGQIHQAAGHRGQAAAALKRLLLVPALPEETRACALWRLARLYQSQGYLLSARDAYLQILARYARVRLPELGSEMPLGDRVLSELAGGPLAAIALDHPRPVVPLPLERRWQYQAPNSRGVRVLGASGMPPSVTSGCAYLVEGTSFSPLDPENRAQRWSAELGSQALWAGYLADKVVAATAQRIVALDPLTGTEQWRLEQGAAWRAGRGPDPFARGGAAAADEEGPGTRFHDFHLVDGRIFCLRGQEELLAIDGETGAIDWSFLSKGGAINPRLWIGPQRAVLQVQNPNRLLVLETETGSQVSRTLLSEGETLERPPVPIDDDHVLVVPDRRTIKKFDLACGQFTWDYRESAEMPVNGPPRVLADGERLLVLHDGRLLVRLDPQSGAKRWSTMLGIEDLSERPEAIACDLHRVYYASQQTLRTLAMDDGTPLWSSHLTGPENARWSVLLSERYVLAYASLSNCSEEELETMPVVIRRQDNGALLQRFVFPATSAEVNLRLDARGMMVATSRSLWALSRRDTSMLPRPSPPP